MNLPIFILIIMVVTTAALIVVVLQTSLRADLGIRDTLRELWHTYFGHDDKLPHDPARNRKLK